MPTEEELELRRRRRGWWLRVSRAGLGQAGVAKALGLSEKSASTVGDWERGVSEPSLRQLELLAALYDVPLALFTDPPMTDEERLERMRGLATGALAAEAADWEQGSAGEPTRDAGDEPGGLPGRRSA